MLKNEGGSDWVKRKKKKEIRKNKRGERNAFSPSLKKTP